MGEIAAFDKASLFSQEEQQDDIKVFGTADNKEALQKNMSKLILCVEMENWEKAESFMDTIKQLSAGAPREVSRAVLRLKMAIQKEDYDTAVTGFDELKILVE